MFVDQGHVASQDRMRSLHNVKMAEGTSVRDHCLKMIACLNEREVLGVEIDGESHVDIIIRPCRLIQPIQTQCFHEQKVLHFV